MEKVYLDKGLWYIKNFLTKEEIKILKKYCDEPTGWYTTMRSHYKNILNKFPLNVPEYDDQLILKFPDSKSVIVKEIYTLFYKPKGIFKRLDSVLPEGYSYNSGIQTFKYCTDEEISKNLDETFAFGNSFDNAKPKSVPANEVDYAMNWHWETPGKNKNRTASHSIYLNDDFEGGYVEFKKGYVIKPEAGMLLNIPIGEEFEHRVTKVLGPNSRHTLYGQCWSNLSVPVSTKEDC